MSIRSTLPLGAVEAARANLILPVLVGPEIKIRAAATQAGLDLSPMKSLQRSTARLLPRKLSGLRRQGRSLMKGALHTEELMLAEG